MRWFIPYTMRTALQAAALLALLLTGCDGLTGTDANELVGDWVGTVPGLGGTQWTFKFRESASGLDYTRARWYVPSSGCGGEYPMAVDYRGGSTISFSVHASTFSCNNGERFIYSGSGRLDVFSGSFCDDNTMLLKHSNNIQGDIVPRPFHAQRTGTTTTCPPTAVPPVTPPPPALNFPVITVDPKRMTLLAELGKEHPAGQFGLTFSRTLTDFYYSIRSTDLTDGDCRAQGRLTPGVCLLITPPTSTQPRYTIRAVRDPGSAPLPAPAERLFRIVFGGSLSSPVIQLLAVPDTLMVSVTLVR